MKTPVIVSAQEWEAARQDLLVKEKQLTRARDALAAERRRMPWLAVGKAYAFEGPDGMASLLDLFDGRRQLILYRALPAATSRWGAPGTTSTSPRSAARRSGRTRRRVIRRRQPVGG